MGVGSVFVGFFSMMGLLLMSFPIAVIMVVLGVIGGVMLYGWPLLNSMGPVIWGVQNENILTAIPLFVLLGELLLRSGIADRMYGAMAMWLGRLPGGLLHTNIGCCSLFAATSGSSVATAATVGTVALPALGARGYGARQSLGSLAAGGTLGILIPPSVNLLIYGSLAGESIGRLFIAGIVPGVALTLLFMVYIAAESFFIKEGAGTPDDPLPLREKLSALRHLIPPAIIFAVVMGSIYMGIATPTESAALGSITAVIIGAAYRALSWEKMGRALMETLKLSVMILFIIAASQTFAQVLSFSGATNGLINAINAVDPTPLMVLLGMIAILLFLGCFIDQVSMLMVTVPVFVPLAGAMEINELTLGVVYLLTMEIGLLTPPFGLLLFVMRGVAPPEIRMPQIYASVMPFLLIKLFVLALIVWLPEVATWLPSLMGR